MPRNRVGPGGLLLLLVALSNTVVASASAREALFVYPQVRQQVAPSGSSPAAISETLAAVDVVALSTSDRASVEVVLPDGARFEAVADEIVRRGAMSFGWRGRLVGLEEEGEGVITVHRGHVAGLLTLPGRSLELVPDAAGAGMVRLLELDGRLFPGCLGQVEPHEPMPSSLSLPEVAPTSGHRPLIDLLVVYTANTRRAAGGGPQIRTTAQAAVDVTNAAFANSEVNQRVALVRTAEVPYDETGIPMNEQLVWLRNDSSVAALREAHSADLVALISESPPGCGIAYVMRNVSPAFEAAAFSVTHRPCAVGNRTFAHELGHNMGLEHDPQEAPPPHEASFPWSFGHFVDGVLRTVMAYWTSCSIFCPDSGRFSNPDVTYSGHPTGIAGRRDNARTLELTGPVVERFRVGGVDPPSGFAVTVHQDRAALIVRPVYRLRWDPHPEGVGYWVYRARDGGTLQRVTAAPITATTFDETGPPGEAGREYAVSAALADGRESRRTPAVRAGGQSAAPSPQADEAPIRALPRRAGATRDR